MATEWNAEQAQRQGPERLPEVVDATECGPIELVFRDARVADDDAFEMPDDSD